MAKKFMYRARIGGYLSTPDCYEVTGRRTAKKLELINGRMELIETKNHCFYPTLKEAWGATLAAARKNIEEAERQVACANSRLLELHCASQAGKVTAK